MKNKYNILIIFFTFIVVLRSIADNGRSQEGLYYSDAELNRLYDRMKCDTFPKMSRPSFVTALRGYQALLLAGKITGRKNLLAICDYSLSSVQKRFWVVDVALNKVLYHTFMAHGQGSGEEYALQFSNRENSHQSSLGFFITGGTYTGKHGLSLYLHGMDDDFNCDAYKRSIVMHAADYVSEQFIIKNKRLGRSWGCPALPTSAAVEIINLLQNGTCFFAYYPSTHYLNSSRWLGGQRSNFCDAQFLFEAPSVPNGEEQQSIVANE